jgi:hypothetical protein
VRVHSKVEKRDDKGHSEFRVKNVSISKSACAGKVEQTILNFSWNDFIFIREFDYK